MISLRDLLAPSLCRHLSSTTTIHERNHTYATRHCVQKDHVQEGWDGPAKAAGPSENDRGQTEQPFVVFILNERDTISSWAVLRRYYESLSKLVCIFAF